MNDLTRVDDKVTEFKTFVNELVKSQAVDDSIIFHSGQSRLKPSVTKISDEEYKDINDAYIKGMSFYKKKDYEKAIFYFDAIVNKYNRYINNFEGFYNPVLYSELLLYRIYKKIYSSTMPSKRIIGFLAQNVGILSVQMFDSIISNNLDIFTKQELDFIQKSYFFYHKKLLDVINSEEEYKSPGVFLISVGNKFKRYLYLLKRTDLHLIVYLVKSDKLLPELRNYQKKLKNKSFDLEFNLERFERRKLKDSFCGIGYRLKINPVSLVRIKGKVDQKLVAIFFTLLIIYFIILFSMGRYIFLLHKLQKIKDDFLHIISHELKTPLATIKLYADTITGAKDVKSIPRFAGIISSKTNQISNIISNMLYFNKLSDVKHSTELKKRIHQKFKTVKIFPMIKKICEDYNNCYQKEFLLDFNDREFELNTDENLIRIIFSNLIENSFKHDRKNNIAIRIKLINNSEDSIIEYEDSIETIEKIDIDSIFNKYEMTSDKNKSGSNLGLGLYIVKNILALLGGSIEAVGENSLKFTIKLGITGKNNEE
ncbi:HAMP domain-containing histidine kinase [bacterium]|nr:HAMP domain-containing histidine kinase [bacterium]